MAATCTSRPSSLNISGLAHELARDSATRSTAVRRVDQRLGETGRGRIVGDQLFRMELDAIKAWLTERPFSEPPPVPELAATPTPPADTARTTRLSREVPAHKAAAGSEMRPLQDA